MLVNITDIPTITGLSVSGKADSPDENYIEFVLLLTETGTQMKWLKPSMAPIAVFRLALGDKAITVYVFECCNLYGLWKAEV